MSHSETFVRMRNLTGKRVKIGAHSGIVETVGINWQDDFQIQFDDGMCICVNTLSEVEICNEKQNTVTQKRIDHLMNTAVFTEDTRFDKCTIVAAQLENGFVIVESSACVAPANYDYEMGVQICKDKIRKRLWELEGYALHKTLYEQGDLPF